MNLNDKKPAARWPVWLVAALLIVFGLPFVAGGGYLLSLGGSAYFLLAGVGLLASAALMLRGRASGAWLLALVVVATTAWAVVDVGFDFWALFSRLFAFGVVGVLAALAYPSLQRGAGRGAYALAAVLALADVAAFAAAFVPHPTVANGNGPGLTAVDPALAQKDWAHYGNTVGGSRFVALDQINRSNVDKLQVAWTFHTGDVAVSDGNGAEDQLTPLQIGERVFICTPHNDLIALDADTGKQLWRHDVHAQSKVWQRCRPATAGSRRRRRTAARTG